MKLENFVYLYQSNRVVFGYGSLKQLGVEIERLGCIRIIIICTKNQVHQANQIKHIIGDKAVGVFDKAVMHVPAETAKEAFKVVNLLNADCAVAFGGGSTIGLAKAIALEYSIPIIAIPTTYAGSEMTQIYGITDNKLKKTGRDLRVLPKTVIYDPELTMTLPLEVSLTSGINAIAHAAEGLYAQDGNPIMSLFAEEGIREMSEGLSMLKENHQNEEARSKCLYAAWLCGSVLGNVSMALHHKLCHTLGGSFNLNHALIHTVILPQAIAYNEVARPEVTKIITQALNVSKEDVSGGQALYDFERSLGLNVRLSEIGFKENDIQKATDIAMLNPYRNPRPFDRKDIEQIITKAYHGMRP